jgi:hypothetical protein
MSNSSILKAVWELWRRSTPIPIIHGSEINASEVQALLDPFTTNQWISDGVFECIDTENLKAYLKKDPVSDRMYKAESFDCDDYSYSLMGNITQWYPEGSIGIVWGEVQGGGHAWNFYIDENKTIQYIEPQTDQIYSPSNETVWIMVI